jgi:Flp pilus assembly protein TadG
MQKSRLSQIAKRMIQRGQTGQTILILAIGFIMLLAFVGIVTDVSLLFVRYSSLRRAVDAAAVAAAGQMRRAVPTAEEITRASTTAPCNASQAAIDQCAYGYAFGRNLTNVNLAARQFIEFYGLVPTNVVVNTCATTAKNAADAVNAQGTPVKVFDPDLECDDSQTPRKLVRVIAQVESPTVFLRLIGWGNITLEASAISETAVLDVVMIFDASESMLNQTGYDEWKTVPTIDTNGNVTGVTDQSTQYLPPRMDYGPNYWPNNPAKPSGQYDFTGGAAGQWLADPTVAGDYYKAWRKVLLEMDHNAVYSLMNDVLGTPAVFPMVGFKKVAGAWQRVADLEADPTKARTDCRVRFFPGAGTIDVPDSTYTFVGDLRQDYEDFLRSQSVILQFGTSAQSDYPVKYDGFVPAFNFYGCCNDPNGDFQFQDLICEPMRTVRDRTEDFLDRIDFVRGDRVAFVTFDRAAYLIDPDGTAGHLEGTTTVNSSPMITNQNEAIAALRRSVGVRAEPSYYADTLNPAGVSDGAWDGFVTNGAPYNPSDPVRGGKPQTYSQSYDFASRTYVNGNGFNNTLLGTKPDYPVYNNCVLQNAALQFPLSIYSSLNFADASAFGYAYIESRYPTPLAALYSGGVPSTLSFTNPNLNHPTWDASLAASNSAYANPDARAVAKAFYSYEFRAACGGSNVGAALRTGSNALLDPQTVRLSTAGGVWVMVMLGDGAAGGTDPVKRNGVSAAPGDPYGTQGSALPIVARGQYGSYGLCPYGRVDSLGPLVDNNGSGPNWNTAQPRCMDPNPATRHACPNSAPNADSATLGSGNLDILSPTNCEEFYDADDFARDWADYIALSELPTVSPFLKADGSNKLRSDIKLPTMFTIGFGLDFQSGDGSCGANVPDCLGEELLRYIADIGDNNRIDTDYQQDFVNDGVVDGVTVDGTWPTDAPSVVYGDRGECENQTVTYSPANLMNSALAPKASCGNYFNAPDGPELQKVFDEIASRMFTRITG